MNEWSFIYRLIQQIEIALDFTVGVTFLLLGRPAVLPGKVVSIKKKTTLPPSEDKHYPSNKTLLFFPMATIT